MTEKRDIAGTVLIDVLLAAMLMALIAVPLVSILVTSHKNATLVEQRLSALNLAQSHLEDLLATGSEAWTSKPFRPLPDNPDFDLAVNINHLPARLYEIHIFIRWGEATDDQILELATLVTAKGRSKP